MGFMRWCNVVVVLNAMPIFVFLNKIGNFSDLWAVEGKCCRDLFCQYLNEHNPMLDLLHSNTARHNPPDA